MASFAAVTASSAAAAAMSPRASTSTAPTVVHTASGRRRGRLMTSTSVPTKTAPVSRIRGKPVIQSSLFERLTD